jgi:hypothetical protein
LFPFCGNKCLLLEKLAFLLMMRYYQLLRILFLRGTYL